MLHSLKNSGKTGGLLLAILLTFSACESQITIKNGELSEDLLPLAAPFVGEYEGNLYQRPMRFRATLEGNKPVVQFEQDLLGTRCGSSVGNLETLWIKTDKKTKNVSVKSLDFHFNPGTCSHRLEGRTLSLRPLKTNDGSVQLELYLEIESRRSPDCSSYGEPPTEVCTGGSLGREIIGTFRKL